MSSSWNKGLTKETDPRVTQYAKTLSKNMQGKKLSEEHKNAISRSLLEHKCSEETKENISNSLRNSESYRASRETETFKKNMSRAKRGQIPWNRSENPRKNDHGDEFTHLLKENIKKRDYYRCTLCGKKQLDIILENYLRNKQQLQKLSIHHIDYNKKNNNEDNLITLCNNCHGKTGSKDKSAWIVVFDLMLGNGERKDFFEECPQPRLGTHKPKSNEHKKHISEALKNSKKFHEVMQSEKYREKQKFSHKGKTPWNKGLTNEDPRVAQCVRTRIENKKIAGEV
jgi:5-methylcytosine-specific restriction endonuclease McrA